VAGVAIRNPNAFHWKKVLDNLIGTKIERRFEVKKILVRRKNGYQSEEVNGDSRRRNALRFGVDARFPR
jgi:hypothetical protein